MHGIDLTYLKSRPHVLRHHERMERDFALAFEEAESVCMSARRHAGTDLHKRSSSTVGEGHIKDKQ